MSDRPRNLLFLAFDVMAETTLSSAARTVFKELANRADDNGECFPKAETIACHTGLNPKTVWRALAELKDADWISRTSRRRPKAGYLKTSNLYRINVERLRAPMTQKRVIGTEGLCTENGTKLCTENGTVTTHSNLPPGGESGVVSPSASSPPPGGDSPSAPTIHERVAAAFLTACEELRRRRPRRPTTADVTVALEAFEGDEARLEEHYRGALSDVPREGHDGWRSLNLRTIVTTWELREPRTAGAPRRTARTTKTTPRGIHPKTGMPSPRDTPEERTIRIPLGGAT